MDSMKSREVSDTARVAEAASGSTASAETHSIGIYLAGQRRLRGISIEELATRTRIPLRSLERLEAGVFDSEIDGFVRGFVRTVAEALGLDAGDTLARTLAEPEIAQMRAGRPRPSVRRMLLALGLVMGLVAVVAGISSLPIGAVLDRDSGDESERVIRRDPVRALVDAQVASAPPVGSAGEEHRLEP
jgi:hypothetical protein